MSVDTTKQAKLDDIAARIIADDVCPELKADAKQLVFADGNPDADIVFIGEAPGQREDELGKPFVGAAGKFLDEMLGQIGLERSDIYITNIVKYRPPNNRDPEPEEKTAFMPYLFEQLTVIQPKLVVFLGRHAMNVFFPQLSISNVHGKALLKDDQLYLALYHPAAALYNGGMRATLEADFAKIPAIVAKSSQIGSDNTTNETKSEEPPAVKAQASLF